jgi:hypothetical protein
VKVKQYSKQYWAIKNYYKKKSTKMLIKKPLLITKPLPIIKNVTFNGKNYDYCLISIHGKKILELYLWSRDMKNLMNERLIIDWKGKEKIGLQKWDNYRIKYQSKIYQSI